MTDAQRDRLVNLLHELALRNEYALKRLHKISVMSLCETGEAREELAYNSGVFNAILNDEMTGRFLGLRK